MAVPILEEILAAVRQRLAVRKARVSLEGVKAQAEGAADPRDFAGSLDGPGIGLIAEVKRASPSGGVLAREFDPVGLARLYAENGARAISILTEECFFQGSLDFLASIRREVPLPLLCKDFILEPYQVYEARAHGADAILLIAAILEEEELAGLLALARSLGMEALVEVHSREELEMALKVRPRIMGINNRNLRDFRVDLASSFLLRSYIPCGIIMVSESGIETGAQVESLAQAGFNAVLVGSALVKADDVAKKVKELAGLD